MEEVHGKYHMVVFLVLGILVLHLDILVVGDTKSRGTAQTEST
jgi:hypothetical protein